MKAYRHDCSHRHYCILAYPPLILVSGWAVWTFNISNQKERQVIFNKTIDTEWCR